MLALVGDFHPSVTAHVAIPRALELARQATGLDFSWRWIGTDEVGDPLRSLRDATGIWLVPASPYASMAGALAAIRHAREQGLPFLGTCGGFQHALIEFARHVAGLPDADHAETAAAASANPPPLVITPLACSLVEQSGEISFTPGSRLHAIFGGRPTTEGYHCNYGVNPAYRARLEAAGLRFTGFDAQGLPAEATRPGISASAFTGLAKAGDPRAFELPAHPFFVGTLFQPERSALRDSHHPLVQAFVRAMAGR